jgi:predicted O-linked N-acetylglucosamine transferase (SPINDLY family)
MDPIALRLAAERLAPLQGVAWGQPETSGLPTIDVFLSSALMEPPDADRQYTERLVTLPGLGVHYIPEGPPAEPCSRVELGLRDGATLFWCGQALYKYLPQYDDVFARIASAVVDCHFLFIGFAKSRTVTERFRARLLRTFEHHGLDGSRHIVFLDPMPQARFLGTIRLADIVLDSIGWSGGKSTLDALMEAPAIVTYAGPLMRGRHTMAILTLIGATETIATTLDDYVAIATRLARDPAWRETVRAKIAAGRHRVMADAMPIRALERFLTDSFFQQVS